MCAFFLPWRAPQLVGSLPWRCVTACCRATCCCDCPNDVATAYPRRFPQPGSTVRDLPRREQKGGKRGALDGSPAHKSRRRALGPAAWRQRDVGLHPIRRLPATNDTAYHIEVAQVSSHGSPCALPVNPLRTWSLMKWHRRGRDEIERAHGLPRTRASAPSPVVQHQASLGFEILIVRTGKAAQAYALVTRCLASLGQSGRSSAPPSFRASMALVRAFVTLDADHSSAPIIGRSPPGRTNYLYSKANSDCRHFATDHPHHDIAIIS